MSQSIQVSLVCLYDDCVLLKYMIGKNSRVQYMIATHMHLITVVIHFYTMHSAGRLHSTEYTVYT